MAGDSLLQEYDMGFRSANINASVKLVSFVFLLLLIFDVTLQTATSKASDLLPGPVVPDQDLVLPENVDSPWLKLWRQARQAARQGDLATAVVIYQDLLGRRPHVDEARWELARIYIDQNKLDQAIALMENLIEGNPENIIYLNALAKMMQQLGQLDRALDLLSRALAIDPDNSFSLATKASVLHVLDREQEELAYLEKLANLEDLDLSMKEQLARGFFDLKLYEKARPLAVELAVAEHASLSSLILAAKVHGALALDNPAAGYWQQVLAYDPSLVEAHRWLARYLDDQGRQQEALVHYLFLHRRFPQETINLLKIAQIYTASSGHETALPYLQKYLSQHPFDLEGVRCLVDIYASLGNQAQTLAAIDRYFALDPDPSPDRLRQAARLYDAAGRYHDAIPLYRLLLQANPLDPLLLAALADDLLAIGDDDGALRVLSLMASGAPDDGEIFLAISNLLERLGRHEELCQLLTERHQRVPDDHEVTLKLVLLLLDRGERDEAMAAVSDIIGLDFLSPMLLEQRAIVFQNLGMTVRALADYENILSQQPDHYKARQAAVKLAASLGRLAVLQRHVAMLTGAELPGAELSSSELAERLRTHLLDSYGLARIDSRQTMELADSFVMVGDPWSALVLYQMLVSDESLPGGLICKLKLAMAEIKYAQGLVFEAEQYLRDAWLGSCREGNEGQQFASLMEMVEYFGGDPVSGPYFLWPMPDSLTTQDPAGLMELARLAEKNGGPEVMATLALAAVNQVPDSLTAGLLLVRAHELQGDLAQAAHLLDDLLVRFPGMLSIIERLAVISYQQGQWERALSCCRQVLVIDPSRQDMHRIRARILWRQGKRDEAVDLYRSLLEPPVLDLVSNSARQTAVPLPLASHDSGWDFVFSESDDPLADLMEIDFANDLRHRRLSEVVLPYYAKYRWQHEVSLELASRQAIIGREYRRAAYYLNLILKTDPADPFILFDLADVYGHLYRLEDEAALYARIQRQNADYPGLDEAWNQNRQRRRPSMTLTSSLAREEGRDGYKAMEQRLISLTGRFSPNPEDDLSLDLQRIHYLASDRDDRVWASRFLLTWHTSFFDHIDLFLGTGLEYLEDEGAQTALVDCRLKGQLGDMFSAELLLRRGAVSDTMASLQRNIVAEDMEMSIGMDLSSSFSIGADYGLTSFSDDNDLSSYSFWASYLLLDQEPSHLEFRISYLFEDASEGSMAGFPVLADGFAATDHPYWAPVDYWQTSIGLNWHYLLNHDQDMVGTGENYYAVGYHFKYDCSGHDQHVLSGSVNWQLNNYFEVKADLEYITSDYYRASDVILSLVYRW